MRSSRRVTGLLFRFRQQPFQVVAIQAARDKTAGMNKGITCVGKAQEMIGDAIIGTHVAGWDVERVI